MSLRVAVLLAATVIAQTALTLEQYLERKTGAAAVDCGTFSMLHNGVALPPRRGATATNKVDSMRESLTCAADALASHKGFKIVQRGVGIDSELASGLFANADGVTMWFDFDSAPCGGPGCAPTFRVRPCALADMRIVDVPGNHRFRCGQ